MQWSKEEDQKDQQLSTKHYAVRTPLKPRVSSCDPEGFLDVLPLLVNNT